MANEIFPAEKIWLLSKWFTAGPAADRLIDAGDGVVERKKDFVAVIKQPRAYNGAVRRSGKRFCLCPKPTPFSGTFGRRKQLAILIFQHNRAQLLNI